MIVTNVQVLLDCVRRHANSKKAIKKFLTNLEAVNVTNHNELLAVFPTADLVGGSRYVFDIRFNKYRVICVIVFELGTAQIRFAGTHAEYDRISAKTV